MSGRNHAYLDLAALPAIGPALLAERPSMLWSADGRRILWSNAAGAAFLGESSMAALLERRFSPALPSAEQISRFARNLPAGAVRLERIRFPAGPQLASFAATCTRLALPDGTAAVLVALDPVRGRVTSAKDEARRLVELLGAEDCLIAILDAEGDVVAASGGFETMAAGEAAIEDLLAAVARSGERLVKRAIRIGDMRRPAGLARIPGGKETVHLLIVGPAERIVVEPVAEPRPVMAVPVTTTPVAETEASAEAVAAPVAAVVPDAPVEAAAIVDDAAEVVAAAPEPDRSVEPTTAVPPPVEAQVDDDVPAVAMSIDEEAAPLLPEIELDRLAGPLEADTVAANDAFESPPVAESGPVEAPKAPGVLEQVETEPASAKASRFQFVEPSGPLRFVFQMDADGRFTFVSPEFSAAVGPESAGIVGALWGDVAAKRGLDRDGSVARIISRRDTWSGVSLAWPVDGSGERIAVDLAALPAFSRDRAFEGYRGFGVIRPRDRRREPVPPPLAAVPPPPLAVVPPRAPISVVKPAEPASVRPPEPSNVVRLPRAGAPLDGEALSVPEQDAFRRIAAALGATTASDAAKAADAAKSPEAAKPPETATPTETVKLAEAPASIVVETPSPEPIRPAPVEPPVVAPEPVAVAAEDVSASAPTVEATPVVEVATVPEVAPIRVEPAVATIVAPATGAAAQPKPDPELIERLAEAGQKIVELEAILDTATDGVIVVDGDGRIERINRSAEALFGVDSASVAGLRFPDLLAEESRKSALDYLDGLARNGVASVLNDGREVIGRVPQGGLIPLFMTMGRLAETGKFCAVLRDITQWKNAEGELINARRAAESASMQKSDFLAKVSHEIRTPLNAIIGFSEVMMEERFGPIGTERYKEYLRDIHISGAHLMSLLNDLLDLSKIEAGKLDLTFEAVPLNELVMECVALMQPQANRERIIIRTSLSAQVPSIVADPRSIRQIVLNLVSNAVKFTLAGGQVIVSTVMEERGEVTLRIRDTGVGMSEKDIETALKPFRQLSSASKPRSDGTGLGLPLTKALVEANRAAFQIDSTVGQGTLIRITFPATRVLAE